MSWRRFLLVPRLARAGLRRSRTPDRAWQEYWASVRRTGPEGDVLWDGAGDDELAWWHDMARRHLDPALPVLDAGCGNGRLSRVLAADFPQVLGVDLSSAAVSRAAAESASTAGMSFRTLDLAAPDAAAQLRSVLGPTNAVVRGVLHVLEPAVRRRVVATLREVTAPGGTTIVLETAHSGDALDYLEYLAASRPTLPPAVERLIRFGVPRPHFFDEAALRECFAAERWTVVESGSAAITPVILPGSNPQRPIAGVYAVVRPTR